MIHDVECTIVVMMQRDGFLHLAGVFEAGALFLEKRSAQSCKLVDDGVRILCGKRE